MGRAGHLAAQGVVVLSAGALGQMGVEAWAEASMGHKSQLEGTQGEATGKSANHPSRRSLVLCSRTLYLTHRLRWRTCAAGCSGSERGHRGSCSKPSRRPQVDRRWFRPSTAAGPQHRSTE